MAQILKLFLSTFYIVLSYFVWLKCFCDVGVMACTLKPLKIGTDRFERTVLTQIRLNDQFAQGLHRLPFHLHYLDALLQ